VPDARFDPFGGDSTMPRDSLSQTGRRILPRVIATGFTAAFLGDERTLREFVAGDLVARRSRALG